MRPLYCRLELSRPCCKDAANRRSLPALKTYLEGNIGCRALGMPQEQLVELFRDKAGVYLNNGASYGAGGEGFVRINVGCPRSILLAALESIGRAIS